MSEQVCGIGDILPAQFDVRKREGHRFATVDGLHRGDSGVIAAGNRADGAAMDQPGCAVLRHTLMRGRAAPRSSCAATRLDAHARNVLNKILRCWILRLIARPFRCGAQLFSLYWYEIFSYVIRLSGGQHYRCGRFSQDLPPKLLVM